MNGTGVGGGWTGLVSSGELRGGVKWQVDKNTV